MPGTKLAPTCCSAEDFQKPGAVEGRRLPIQTQRIVYPYATCVRIGTWLVLAIGALSENCLPGWPYRSTNSIKGCCGVLGLHFRVRTQK